TEHYNPETLILEDAGTFAGEEKNLKAAFKYEKETIQEKNKPLLVLVEDNEDLRSFLSDKLNDFYTVAAAADGVEGLEKIKSLLPDLVLSDSMMPKMDGITLLDRIKNDKTISHIPVVLLTAKYSIESQIE